MEAVCSTHEFGSFGTGVPQRVDEIGHSSSRQVDLGAIEPCLREHREVLEDQDGLIFVMEHEEPAVAFERNTVHDGTVPHWGGKASRLKQKRPSRNALLGLFWCCFD